MPNNKTLEELNEEGIFPELEDRDAQFPQGECINDVAHRAEVVIRGCILPHLLDESQDGAHIGFASHGICLAELMSALLKLDPEADSTKSYRGHWNTAWSRLEISLRVWNILLISSVLNCLSRESTKELWTKTQCRLFVYASSISIITSILRPW